MASLHILRFSCGTDLPDVSPTTVEAVLGKMEIPIIENGEIREVNISEIVNVILFSYQGVRMWSRIIPVEPKTFRSITDHIRNQLIGENK